MSDSNVLEGAGRTETGRYVIYSADGSRYERGEDQAREMVASGLFRVQPEAVAELKLAPPTERTADTDEKATAPAASVAPTVGRRLPRKPRP